MSRKKPAMVRDLEGNRGKRPIHDDMRGIGVPVAPEHLTAEQRQRWQDIVASLPEALLSRADVQVIERMAVAWTTFRQACAGINQTGLVVRGTKGEPVRNPLLVVRSRASIEMEACSNALGLSPLARTRLTAPENAGNDPLETLLGPNRKPWGDEAFSVKN